MCGAARDLDLVARGDVTLPQDPQVRARTLSCREPLEKSRVSHPQTELEAWEPWLRDLQQHAAERPLLSDHSLRYRQAADREVLTERRLTERAPEFPFPPLDVLARVRVDRLVRATVNGPIRLIVPVEVHATQRDSAGDRVLPNRGQHGVAVHLHGARHADVD